MKNQKNKQLRIHYLQHVSFEGPGCITNWASKNNHRLTSTRFFDHENLPEPDEIDWLVIMGGPMGIYDYQDYPWLSTEKNYIENAINQNKTVIGICLGSQLIADVLGAQVFPNTCKEIGWFDVAPVKENIPPDFLSGPEEKFKAFHWHGDTFNLPPNSVHLFQSEACLNQGFLFNTRVLGLQFHFEMMEDGLEELLSNGSDELQKEPFIQSREEILLQKKNLGQNNDKMYRILDWLVAGQNSA